MNDLPMYMANVIQVHEMRSSATWMRPPFSPTAFWIILLGKKMGLQYDEIDEITENIDGIEYIDDYE